MLLVIFGFWLCGCAEQASVGFTGVGFSERIRADLGPLEFPQGTQAREVFSDGGPEGRSLISPLFPKEISRERLGEFKAADVLWTSGQDLSLSWEVLVYEPRFNGDRPQLTDGPYSQQITERQTKRLTANARGLVQPVTREFLAWDGYVLDSERHPAVFVRDLVGVALVSCVDGSARRDPRSPPIGLDEQCDSRTVLTPSECAPTSDLTRSLFPMTVIGCTIRAPADATFRLEVVDPQDPRRTSADMRPGTFHIPLEIRPHVKVVGSKRVVSRPLRFGEEACTMRTGTPDTDIECDQAHLDALLDWRTCRGEVPRDPARAPRCVKIPPNSSNEGNYATGYSSLRSDWTFSVVDETGRWTENFTDRVQVTHVKVRLERWNGSTRYASAEEIRWLRVGEWRCLPQMEADTGAAVFDMATCVSPDAFVSPAWSARAFSQPLDWTLTFLARPRDGVVVGHAPPPPRLIERGSPPATEPPAEVAVTADGILLSDLPVLSRDAAFLEFHLVSRR
ncbi:MAG TPA: hypothetical protein VL086_13480 [Candidatus Nitrosotalea sp.]|nr:hypothetical protein [Candidatus Nitrosotalea sp.]